MDQKMIVVLSIALIVLTIMVRIYMSMRSEKRYYTKYPGAKLIDDLAKTGQLDVASAEKMIQRIGSAEDQHETVAEIRKEIGLNVDSNSRKA